MGKKRAMIGVSPLNRREMKYILNTNDYRKLIQMLIDMKSSNKNYQMENLRLREELERYRTILSQHSYVEIPHPSTQ